MSSLGSNDYQEPARGGMIANESELTAGVRVVPGRRYGFFTDTTRCIGCKACEVACKEWNGLPADHLNLSGMSYDNTRALSANTWRHDTFVEKLGSNGDRPTGMPPYQSHWLMMSDVCKHCANAGCVEACPTGALFRTELDTVLLQQDIWNGCGYCVPSCPFGVVELSKIDGKAHKCTLCYDRLKGGLEPACAKSCPTNSIQFGEIDDLHRRAARREAELHVLGVPQAYV
jgi:formate dehydrogenase iron-sulfur subunit